MHLSRISSLLVLLHQECARKQSGPNFVIFSDDGSAVVKEKSENPERITKLIEKLCKNLTAGFLFFDEADNFGCRL